MAIYYVATYCLSKKKTNSRWAINIAMLKQSKPCPNPCPPIQRKFPKQFYFLGLELLLFLNILSPSLYCLCTYGLNWEDQSTQCSTTVTHAGKMTTFTDRVQAKPLYLLYILGFQTVSWIDWLANAEGTRSEELFWGHRWLDIGAGAIETERVPSQFDFSTQVFDIHYCYWIL